MIRSFLWAKIVFCQVSIPFVRWKGVRKLCLKLCTAHDHQLKFNLAFSYCIAFFLKNSVYVSSSLQASALLLWNLAKVYHFSTPADPLDRSSLDSSVAPLRGARRGCWGPGGTAQSSAAKGKPCSGSTCRCPRREVYHRHPNLQPHRHFTQTPEPLPGSASSSDDHHSLEQHQGADSGEAVGIPGSSSSPGGL